MNWRRLALIVGLVVVVVGGLAAVRVYEEVTRAEAARQAAARTPILRATPVPPRPWRWATEGEWVVHEVVRGLASWADLATDGALGVAKVRVKRRVGSAEPGVFEVELESKQGPRKLELRPVGHLWEASAYVDLVRSLIDGGVTPAGRRVATLDGLLLESDTASLRRADKALSVEILREPRSATLHDQAALLWAAHALREFDGEYADDRAFLNGITTHLALASALGGDAHTTDGELAASALDALLYRQTDAMARLDRLKSAKPGGAAQAWASALTLRVTRDPRRIGAAPRLSRLEKLEGLRAIHRARTCRAATQQAQKWGLPQSAEWVRELMEFCVEPERSQLAARYWELQATDAARLADLSPEQNESILPALVAVSARNTHDPSRPTAVIPDYVRADAGTRHVLSSVVLIARDMRRRAQPEAIKALGLAMKDLAADVPQRPLLELALEGASQAPGDAGRKPPQAVCDRLARLIADRPDLLPMREWPRGANCASASLLSMAGAPDAWRIVILAAGTGRSGSGPWRTGPIAAGDAALEAARRAPWLPVALQRVVQAHHGNAPSSIVTETFGELLDYDLPSMQMAFVEVHADDDLAQRLAERICEINVELCASYAQTLAALGRDVAAEKLWKRALAGAQDSISLSNELSWYVNLLLNRGDEREALRVAQRAADVYSSQGLATLAYVHERQGRFEEAAQVYAAITARYDDRRLENTFHLRYRQRHGEDRFAENGRLAAAEVFPQGLLRKSLDDFSREGNRGGILVGHENLTEPLHRLGVRDSDLLVAFDDYAVGNWDQWEAGQSFTDAQTATAIVSRQGKGFLRLSGPYLRINYGSLPGRPAASTK